MQLNFLMVQNYMIYLVWYKKS